MTRLVGWWQGHTVQRPSPRISDRVERGRAGPNNTSGNFDLTTFQVNLNRCVFWSRTVATPNFWPSPEVGVILYVFLWCLSSVVLSYLRHCRLRSGEAAGGVGDAAPGYDMMMELMEERK